MCELYGESHDVLFNHKKSVIMIFRCSYMMNVSPPPYTLNGKIIAKVDSLKYLGHIICNDSKDDMDIMRQCQQLHAPGNVLFRKFHMFSVDVKIKLFHTYSSPMCTAQLWKNHTSYTFHRLHVCYKNILKRLLGRPRFCSASRLFAECRLPNCKALIRNLVFKFMLRISKSTNTLISAILASDIRWTSRIRRYWVKLLYVHHDLV